MPHEVGLVCGSYSPVVKSATWIVELSSLALFNLGCMRVDDYYILRTQLGAVH